MVWVAVMSQRGSVIGAWFHCVRLLAHVLCFFLARLVRLSAFVTHTMLQLLLIAGATLWVGALVLTPFPAGVFAVLFSVFRSPSILCFFVVGIPLMSSRCLNSFPMNLSVTDVCIDAAAARSSAYRRITKASKDEVPFSPSLHFHQEVCVP